MQNTSISGSSAANRNLRELSPIKCAAIRCCGITTMSSSCWILTMTGVVGSSSGSTLSVRAKMWQSWIAATAETKTGTLSGMPARKSTPIIGRRKSLFRSASFDLRREIRWNGGSTSDARFRKIRRRAPGHPCQRHIIGGRAIALLTSANSRDSQESQPGETLSFSPICCPG